MRTKEELEIEIETIRENLEMLEQDLWEINTRKWCVLFLKENK